MFCPIFPAGVIFSVGFFWFYWQFSYRGFCLFLDSFSRNMESFKYSSSSNLNLFSSFFHFFYSSIGILFTLLRSVGQSFEGKFSGPTKEWFTTNCDGVGVPLGSSSLTKEICCSFSLSPVIVGKGSATQKCAGKKRERSKAKKEVQSHGFDHSRGRERGVFKREQRSNANLQGEGRGRAVGVA